MNRNKIAEIHWYDSILRGAGMNLITRIFRFQRSRRMRVIGFSYLQTCSPTTHPSTSGFASHFAKPCVRSTLRSGCFQRNKI